MDGSSPTPLRFRKSPRQAFQLKRWYRGKRDISTWDGVRRDVDLFEDGANCSVFLYAKGQSQRGPAFRLPRSKLIEAQCNRLLKTAIQNDGRFELYLPAPAGLLREDSLKCHISTRNFFAWLCHRPLVGQYLGEALAELLESMRTWRDEAIDNIEDVLIFADRMGYSSVEHRPDNALAMLAFSERARLSHVWIDSFAHCAAMNEDIVRSAEYGQLSHATRALIQRAYLELDLHLDQASRALVGFLENELSASYLGLPEGARQHLDSFRSFLHAFYVGRFGYWPPYHPTNFPKDLYYDMYDDFSCLHHLLADKASNDVHPALRTVNGGICVEQNIEALNQRHKFNPLPYTLPLVPHKIPNENSKSQINLRSFRFARDSSVPRASKRDNARASVRAATNSDNEVVNQSGLVQQYLAWEDEYAARSDQKVSAADARKVRWILIYGLLQTLVSAIQAPPEVRETTTASYPLCISTDGLPPWSDKESLREHPRQRACTTEESEPPSPGDPSDAARALAPTPTLSIHPDCETENYLDYWTSKNGSFDSYTVVPKTSLKRAGTKLRKASIKRKSLPPTALQISTLPELVSGRTLAELAYGDHSKPSSDSSPAMMGFDFGFEQQGDTAQDSTTQDDPQKSDALDDKPTFDNLQDSLPAHAVSHPKGEIDDSSSIPSLTYSQGSSRNTISSASPDRSSAIQYVDEWKARPSFDSTKDDDGDDKQVSSSSSEYDDAMEDKLYETRFGDQPSPYVVTGFTDLFAKTDYNGPNSDDSSVDEDFDRAAVIERDGTLDQDLVDGYRSMTVV